MKIGSAFDTQIKPKEFAKYGKKYGAENIVIIDTSSIYTWIQVVPKLLLYAGAGLLSGYVVGYILPDGNTETTNGIISTCVGFFIFFIFSTDCRKLIIDYYMDFAIVTPHEVIAYNQEGFFKRDNKTLGVDKIKSINVMRSGVIASILNEGDIVFSGDGATTVDIVKDNIHHPDAYKQRILDLWDKHKSHKGLG